MTGSDDVINAFFGSDGSGDTVRHSGFIAVAGRPNAGKSTLVNHIVGQHVAIVSPIAQTTRRVVRAVARRGDTQLVFVDLPGSQKPLDAMTERMQGVVVSSFDDVDAVVWVVDVRDTIGPGDARVANLVLSAGVPVVLALNKIDGVMPATILERIAALQELMGDREFTALVPISARRGDGIDTLVDALVPLMPEGPAWFGDEDVVDMRDEERIAEYVREATLAHLRDELPHASVVTVDELEEDPDDPRRMRAACTIWVERQSQVGIVVGKGGAQIKAVGIAARRIIERELDQPFHLELRVKVRKGWRNDQSWLARTGL